MKERGVVITCGTCGGSQRLVMEPHTPRQYAQDFGQLLDGTSSLFVNGPRPDRSDCLPGAMGRCGRCDGVFRATLFGFDEES